MAVINGTSGNDTLADTSGDDTINGLGGNDTINGGSGGSDVVNGGDGRDSLQFMSAISPVLVDFGEGVVAGGRPTSDVTFFTNIEKVVTGDFNDELRGDAAAQNLTARAGMDTLWGAGGFDTLWGGAGADTFIFREFGAANADNIGDWTSSSDKLLLDATVMTALGTSGSFTAGDARFWASSAGTAHDADDRIIYETDTRQVWYDADGNGAGARQLIATLQSGATLVATDIVVEGGSSGGGQVINGTSGNDSLVGTAGDDTINGLGGNDTIAGGIGNDLMNGGTGNDSLRASEDDNDTLIGADGNDTLDGVFHAFAEQDPGVDTLDGGLGDDLFRVDNAADVLSDTGGMDTVEVHNIGWTLGAGYENLHLNNDEAEFRVIGIGNELDNVMSGSFEVQLEGLDGNDTLQGSAWSDTLNGGADRDTLTGGSGADTFVFDNDIDEDDTLTDFASGTDKLRLDGITFTEIGASGNFAPNDARFSANSTGTAEDTSDRIIYNTTSGQLWYDPDGTGAEAAWLFAMLEGAPALAATDLEVINGSASGQLINGTSGDDTLTGTAGNDTINGLDGDDMVDGLAGDDELIGGAGADTLIGGDGNDTLDGANDSDGFGDEWTADTLEGGLGNDVYYAHAFDSIIESAGTDTLYTSAGADGFPIDVYTLPADLENLIFRSFEPGFDGEGVRLHYRGNASDNVISIDNLHESSSSTLDGGAGRDTLDGSGGEVDYIFSVAPGEANADTILGGGSPHVFAGATLVFDANAYAGIGPSGSFTANDARFAANSTGTAQDASDRVVYNTSTGQLWYDADGTGTGAAQLVATLQAAPTLAATDIQVVNGASGHVINGTSGADTLADTAENDTINALAGNDTINGGHGGSDVVNGGDGRDTLAFMTATGAVVFDFDAGTMSGGGVGSTSFTGIERAISGDFNDTLIGNEAAQNLTARAGSDTLEGAGGVDTLWGGAGNDTFIFREVGTAIATADTIGDWSSGSDEFALDNAQMFFLGAEGAFSAGDARFWASSTGVAHDADDRVIYNTSTRGLYYDQDGDGFSGAQLIATVQAGATVVATDISVI